MHILTEITCKWTDAVSVSCMFITCNYIPEKNTAYLCMSSPHTTSPQQIINSRTSHRQTERRDKTSDLRDHKPDDWHEQKCAEPDSVMTFSHPGQEGTSDGHLSFPVSIMGEPESIWSEKNKTKRISTQSWDAISQSRSHA